MCSRSGFGCLQSSRDSCAPSLTLGLALQSKELTSFVEESVPRFA